MDTPDTAGHPGAATPAHSGGGVDVPDTGDHGTSHAHAHVHGQGRDWWSIGRGTLGTVIALLVVAGIVSLVNSLTRLPALEGQIASLNSQLRELSEKKAEKGDLAHLENKLEDRAKVADSHFKELSEKKAEKSDAAHLELKLDDKADAAPVKNLLDSNLNEIGGLRQSDARMRWRKKCI